VPSQDCRDRSGASKSQAGWVILGKKERVSRRSRHRSKAERRLGGKQMALTRGSLDFRNVD
jgi:hypothetical protein